MLPWTTVGHPGHPEVRFRFLPPWFATDLKVSEGSLGAWNKGALAKAFGGKPGERWGEGAGCPGASGGQQ